MDFQVSAVGFLGFLMMKHCVKMLVLHTVCIREMLNIKECSYEIWMPQQKPTAYDF
jgi:hypothetical protein